MISSSSATLSIDVNDGNAGSGSIAFAYGTSSSNYSSTLSSQTFSGDYTHTATVTGLSTGNAYYFTAFASNTTGSSQAVEYHPLYNIIEPSSHAAGFGLGDYSSFYQMSLTFSAASSISSDGYIITYKSGSGLTGLPTDYTSYSSGSTFGNATVGVILTDDSQTSTTISGLSENTEYEFNLIPFNYTNNDLSSSNFYTGGSIPTTSGTTSPNFSSWTELTVLNTPTARYKHGLVRLNDSSVLMYGGDISGDDTDETWKFDYSSLSWTNLSPATSPEGRFAHAMEHISTTEILMFGGKVDGSDDNDTWIYDVSGNNWVEQNPSTDPGVRRSHKLAKLNSTYILMFGGYDSDEGESLNDTWLYNVTTDEWTEINPPISPSGRRSFSMASLQENEVLLFGGYDDNNELDDTWIFNSTSGSWTEINTTNSPITLKGTEMSKLSNGQVLLFGGYFSGGEGPSSYNEGTWLFDRNSNDWLQMSLNPEPTNRTESALAVMNENNVILFGGYEEDEDEEVDDTWLFNFSTTYTAPQNHASYFSIDNQGITSFEFIFSSASSIQADGFIILYKAGTSFTGLPTNETSYSVGETIGDATVGAVITDNSAITATVNGLTKNTQYHLKIIPFNYDGENLNSSLYNTEATIPSITTQTIPTLGEIAMGSFIILFALGGVWYIRRQS